jgi:hypothetical protein
MKRPYLPLLALLLATACSARAGESSTSRNFIYSDELQTVAYTDLYMVVQALRPSWLRNQSPQSFHVPEQVWVYLDGNRLGGPTELKQILPRSVVSIQFYSPIEATQRWGLDHGQGAIVVTSRR